MSAPRILIVDDNHMNLELVSYMLTADGFDVTVVGDAQGALQAIPLCHPDLILMDIQLPGMDGLELTRRLKSDARTAGIVIVAFTAYVMKGDEDRMRAAGCDGYISKPINVGNFITQVRSALAP